MSSNTVCPDAARLLRAVREARFAAGLACVRCGASSVIRWGHAHGRQRYRCRACRRTFSELTNTPFMYSKRLGKWPQYLACLEASASVRRCSSLLGIHTSTAFYWRHRLLDHALFCDRPRLTGYVELTSFRMTYSEKGSRHGQRDGAVPVFVLIARDRRGASFALPRFSDRVNDHAEVMAERIQREAVVITDRRRYSGAARFARQHAAAELGCSRFHSLQSASTSLVHIGNVVAEIARFRAWLEPFRGVATKYLANYLVWHRRLDGSSEGYLATRWVRGTLAEPTLPANSVAARRDGQCAPPS